MLTRIDNKPPPLAHAPIAFSLKMLISVDNKAQFLALADLAIINNAVAWCHELIERYREQLVFTVTAQDIIHLLIDTGQNDNPDLIWLFISAFELDINLTSDHPEDNRSNLLLAHCHIANPLMIQRLLLRGAEPDVRDSKGQSPFRLLLNSLGGAEHGNACESITLLLLYGCKPHPDEATLIFEEKSALHHWLRYHFHTAEDETFSQCRARLLLEKADSPESTLSLYIKLAEATLPALPTRAAEEKEPDETSSAVATRTFG